jgi:hypothetical protein
MDASSSLETSYHPKKLKGVKTQKKSFDNTKAAGSSETSESFYEHNGVKA